MLFDEAERFVPALWVTRKKICPGISFWKFELYVDQLQERNVHQTFSTRYEVEFLGFGFGIKLHPVLCKIRDRWRKRNEPRLEEIETHEKVYIVEAWNDDGFRTKLYIGPSLYLTDKFCREHRDYRTDINPGDILKVFEFVVNWASADNQKHILTYNYEGERIDLTKDNYSEKNDIYKP